MAGRAKAFLEESALCYERLITKRNLELPDHGWWEVSSALDDAVPEHYAIQAFLDLLNAHMTLAGGRTT